MENTILFVITVVSAIIIGYVAVKRDWKIAEFFQIFASIAYNILIHKIPSYMIFVGGIGLIVIVLIGIYELKRGIECKG